MLDAVAAVTTLHTFFGNNAAVFINLTTATVSFIRYYVPFQQQQHPAFLYVIHTEIISWVY